MREAKSTKQSAVREALLHELALTASGVSTDALVPVLDRKSVV